MLKWPVGEAASGNEGVNAKVGATVGGIGYCEYAYVVQSDGNYAILQNLAGNYVQPSAAAFQAAANSANWAGNGDELVLTDKDGAKTWPIVGTTFILLYRTRQNPAVAREILNYLDWGYREGDTYAGYLDYVTLSDAVVDSIRQRWNRELRGPHGEIIWPAAASQ